MENRVSITDARRRFSALLRGVRMGRRYLITSGGRAIARLIPAETDERSREATRAELLARLKGQPVVKSAKIGLTRQELHDK